MSTKERVKLLEGEVLSLREDLNKVKALSGFLEEKLIDLLGTLHQTTTEISDGTAFLFDEDTRIEFNEMLTKVLTNGL